MSVDIVKAVNAGSCPVLESGHDCSSEQAIAPVLRLHMANSFPEVMTEGELIEYLRIPQVSDAVNFKYVIDHLIRYRDLPCIHLCRKRLFPLEMIRQWVASQQIKGAA